MTSMMERTRDTQPGAGVGSEMADARQSSASLSVIHSAEKTVTGSYDPVDLRLMDTFPASDAVARY